MTSIFYQLDTYEEALSPQKQDELEETGRYQSSSYEKPKDIDNEQSANGSHFHYDEEDDYDEDDEDFEDDGDDVNEENLLQSFLED